MKRNAKPRRSGAASDAALGKALRQLTAYLPCRRPGGCSLVTPTRPYEVACCPCLVREVASMVRAHARAARRARKEGG